MDYSDERRAFAMEHRAVFGVCAPGWTRSSGTGMDRPRLKRKASLDTHWCIQYRDAPPRRVCGSEIQQIDRQIDR